MLALAGVAAFGFLGRGGETPQPRERGLPGDHEWPRAVLQQQPEGLALELLADGVPVAAWGARTRFRLDLDEAGRSRVGGQVDREGDRPRGARLEDLPRTDQATDRPSQAEVPRGPPRLHDEAGGEAREEDRHRVLRQRRGGEEEVP